MGDLERRITLVVLMATIISLGLTSVPANAQFTNFDQNFVHLAWDGFTISLDQPPDIWPDADTSNFDLYTTGGFVSNMDCFGGNFCTFNLVNLVDDLDHKNIVIELFYVLGSNPSEPSVFEVKCNNVLGIDPGTSDGISTGSEFFPGGFSETLDAIGDIWIITYECSPNPDWGKITINFGSIVIPQFMEFWTESYDDVPIGGISIPIDQSALLLAGVQSISMWMIPVVIAGIGIGVFVIKRRK